MSQMRTLALPEDLCDAVEKKFGHKFATLEDLLMFLLRDLLNDNALHADQAEQRLVEERLRELGYL